MNSWRRWLKMSKIAGGLGLEWPPVIQMWVRIGVYEKAQAVEWVVGSLEVVKLRNCRDFTSVRL
jgi:hypothetical protein